MLSNDEIDVCKKQVDLWLMDMQVERKCNNTNAVNKAITKLKEYQQKVVVNYLCEQIKTLIINGKSSENVQKTLNVLSGSFDNFVYAQEAVSHIFNDVMHYLTYSLEQCSLYFLSKEADFHLNQMEAVDLVHTISRLLTLVLKLRRRDWNESKFISEPCYESFASLSVTCSNIICHVDGIAVDTKMNLGMSLWLMKEVTSPTLEAIIKIHEEFIRSISHENLEEDYNKNLIKFIMAASAINVWNYPIITADQSAEYLRFFLDLCERYASETTMQLMDSRALQILGKHKVFLESQLINTDAQRLLACNLMLLEHPVACVRHSGRDLLAVLVKNHNLHETIMSSVLAISVEHKSYFTGLALLATVLDSRTIIRRDENIPTRLFSAIFDPTSVSHVAFAIESLSLNDSLVNVQPEAWCDLWVMPLLTTLSACMPIIAADIERVLQKMFKEFPISVDIVLEKWQNPDSDEKLRGVLTCLKIRNRIKGDGVNYINLLGSEASRVVDIFKACLVHGEDDIRLAAFSLVAEGNLLTESALELIPYFLKYNLNNHRPATRQKILALIKKMLVRINSIYINLLRPSKNREVTVSPGTYIQFMNEFVELCYNNVFAAANFNRLNTVLNILILCQEILDPTFIKNINIYDDKWWAKCLVSLESTYEENKVMAVLLSKKFQFNNMDSSRLCQELRKAFGGIQELEPPTVLNGSYLLCVLLNNSTVIDVFQRFFSSGIDNPSSCADVLCIQILTRYLKVQIQDAEDNLVNAPLMAPMYGTLFAIRIILKDLDKEKLQLDETKEVLHELVKCSFKMADAVSSVVNNSSPEGHLPMDFQKLVDKKVEDDDDPFLRIKSTPVTGKLDDLIKTCREEQCPETKLAIAEGICSLVEKELEIEFKKDDDRSLLDVNCEEWYQNVKRLKALYVEYDCFSKFLEGLLPRIRENRIVTAQALLLCSWRSMKESCFYLGDLISKLPIKESLEIGLITEDLILQIGSKLRVLLSSIKHRGAFEAADVGFSSLCLALYQCPIPNLQNLPFQWLQEVLQEIILPPDDQKVKFTSTRRSAGLPFLVQAIIVTEVSSNFSQTAKSLHYTMDALLGIVESNDVGDFETRLHALNIMRSLFKHAQLGEFVAPYVSRALQLAIKGSRSTTWPERNCSNMLFSCLVIRIFGVSRSRDYLSKKNKMTSKVFFQRFPDLYDFFLSEMSRVEEAVGGVKPQPSLYLVLLILSRLYPPTSEECKELGLEPFIDCMARSASNPIHRIRLLAARAIVPLIPLKNLSEELNWRIVKISNKIIPENLRHGLLLQIHNLLEEYCKHSLTDAPDFSNCWWILEEGKTGDRDVCFHVLHAFVNVIWLAWRHFPSIRLQVKEAVGTFSVLQFQQLAAKNGPDVQSFLACLTLLKLEIVTEDSLSLKCASKLLQQIDNLKNCGIQVVENVCLEFVYFILSPPRERDPDLELSLIEDVVEKMNCMEQNKRIVVEEMLTKHLSHYIESEKNILNQNLPHQQRRLRVVILGIALKKLYSCSEKGLDRNEPFELIRLYSSFWGPKFGPKYNQVVTETFVHSEIIYERLILIMNHLIEDDRQCRLALADFFYMAWWILKVSNSVSNLSLLKLWLILFRLQVDEDETVRLASQKVLRPLVQFCSSEVKLMAINISDGGLTSLRAQEILLNCFVSLRSVSTAFTDLVSLAALTVVLSDQLDESDPLEIFRRGNPNPFCENVSLTRLFVHEASVLLENTTTTLLEPFPVSLMESVKLEFSPIFAMHGLRLKSFSNTQEFLSELRRLDPEETSVSEVFRFQIQEFLSLTEEKLTLRMQIEK